MSDKTLCSEKEIQGEEQHVGVRSNKRRNATFMGESEKAKLMEEISKE